MEQKIIILYVCYWPPVSGVCRNDEVVEFQPRTVTPPKPRPLLLLLHICYWPAPPSPPAIRCPSGGSIPLLPRNPLHQRPYFLCTGSSAHPAITCLHRSIPILTCLSITHLCQSPHPPLLPWPCHSCRIPVTANLFPPPKLLFFLMLKVVSIGIYLKLLENGLWTL